MDDVTPSSKFPSLVFLLCNFVHLSVYFAFHWAPKEQHIIFTWVFLGEKLSKSKTILIEAVNNNTIFTA